MEIEVDGDVERSAEAECPGGSCSLAIDWTFDTTRYPGGTHEITVIAIDGVGHERSETFTVTTPCCSDAQTLWGLAPTTDDIHFGDVDGDELSDLVRRNKLTGGVSVSTSSGESFNTAGSWGEMPLTHLVHVGDANGDGLDDLIGHNTLNGEVRVGLSTGSSFAASSAWGTWPLNATFVVGDVDADDDVDLLGRHPSTSKLITSGSTRQAYLAPVDYTAGPIAGDVAFDDVDGDGAADAIVRDPNTGAVQVALSDVSNFLPASAWGTLEPGRTWRFGDVDADGRSDAVGTRSDADDVVVSASTGSAFAAQTAFGSWGRDVELQLEELDGDGKLDFVGRHPSTGEMRVALNIGPIRAEAPQPEWVPDPDLTYDDEPSPSGSISTRQAGSTTPRKVRLVWQDDRRLVDRAGLFDARTDSRDPFLYTPGDPRAGGPDAEGRITGILRRFKQAGGETVRILAIWGRTERKNPASEDQRYFFNRLDRAVDLVRREGLDVYMTITGVAEAWDCGNYPASGTDMPAFEGFTCGIEPSGLFPAPRYGVANDPGVARLQHWERFVEATVSHFYPRVTTYGIYNEPNLIDRNTQRGVFLRGTDADEQAGIIPARTYRDIFFRGARAARNRRPDVKVLLGELTSAPRTGVLPTSPRTGRRQFTPMEFLVEVMRPGGVFGGPVEAEGLALHPYQHALHPSKSRGPQGFSGMGRLTGRPAGDLQAIARQGLVKRAIELLHREQSGIGDNWFRKPGPDDIVPDLRLTEFGYFNVSLGNTSPGTFSYSTPRTRARNARRIKLANLYWHDDREKAAWWTSALGEAQKARAKWMTVYQAVERSTRDDQERADLVERPRRAGRDYQDYGVFGLTDTPNASSDYVHPVRGTRGYGKDPERRNHTDPSRANPRETYCAIWRWIRRQVRLNRLAYPTLRSNECGRR